MSYNVFIKIDGIEGESSDAKHFGWIEVTSYGVAYSQNISSAPISAGGPSAERADFSEFTFSKFIDKASPLLALACASGTHIDSVIVELCRAGGKKLKYMGYKLANCIISSVKTESKGKRFFPKEHININFGEIEWSYTLQKRHGGWAAGHITSGWNLQKNARV